MSFKNRAFIIIGVLVLLAVSWAVFAYVRGRSSSVDGQNSGTDLNQSAAAPASIKSFVVTRPNFVVSGDNLSKVEIWNSSGASPLLIGTAVKKSGDGLGEVWTLAIPASVGKAAKIYALGFDRNGSPVANMTLPPGEL